MLTRKHMRAIAAIVAEIPGPMQRSITARKFADWLATENPRFSKGKFFEACDSKHATVEEGLSQ